MAVPAVDPQPAHVMLVREGTGCGRTTRTCVWYGRLHEQVAEKHQAEHDPDRAEDGQPRQGVGTRDERSAALVGLAKHAPRIRAGREVSLGAASRIGEFRRFQRSCGICWWSRLYRYVNGFYTVVSVR